ncbi:hypothetical protein BKA63DRAFT_526464 [Paraphoma chrysanthemicola]|nr:hypothetical protein BKA63DRAFT_526464 [Paraphoma chrysanthemicola]
MQSQKGFLRFEVFDPMVDDDVHSVLGYRTVLPKAQSLMVEISTWSLPLYDGTDFHLPEYRPGFKNYWYFPGSKYKDVHFLIPMPALAGRYIVTEAAVNERVWNLAEMSRALPQLQACLFELGKSLTTDYAFGSGQGTVEKRWRIRDWIDPSTYTWHMTMQRTAEHPSLPQVFQYAGLYHFTAPYLERDPANAETIKGTPIFSRDKKAQFGICSWSCSESGETVWVQDGQIGSQTGYRSEPEQGHLHNVASIADQTASAPTDMP